CSLILNTGTEEPPVLSLVQAMQDELTTPVALERCASVMVETAFVGRAMSCVCMCVSSLLASPRSRPIGVGERGHPCPREGYAPAGCHPLDAAALCPRDSVRCSRSARFTQCPLTPIPV